MRSGSRVYQWGLSLVELMVGLTIGLVLTLGLFTLIGSQSATFKIQDDFARMQENGTITLRYVGDSVRMAGFYGYLMDPTNLVTTGVATTTDCGSGANPPAANWALNAQVPVFGFSDITELTVNGILPCILAANFMPMPLGQQILVTRSAAGFRIPDPNADGNLTDGLTAQTNFTTTIYVQGDPNAGLLFYGNDFAALKAATSTRVLPTGADVDIFEYRTHVYYIRPCSRPTGGGATCTGATDDNGQPIPTLVRQELVGSAMVEVPLVEGVERLDLRFGLDTTNDGVVDTYTATPAAADWINVVAVRVTVLVRAPTVTAGHNDADKRYDLDGDNVVDFDCALIGGNSCAYKRKVFTQTFQVRNVAQRRGG